MYDGSVVVWDPETDKGEEIYRDEKVWIPSVCCSPDGSILAFVAFEAKNYDYSQFILWNLDKG